MNISSLQTFAFFAFLYFSLTNLLCNLRFIPQEIVSIQKKKKNTGKKGFV